MTTATVELSIRRVVTIEDHAGYQTGKCKLCAARGLLRKTGTFGQPFQAQGVPDTVLYHQESCPLNIALNMDGTLR